MGGPIKKTYKSDLFSKQFTVMIQKSSHTEIFLYTFHIKSSFLK
jgi:hypothetical protein